MTFAFSGAARQIGVPEETMREQFTADVQFETRAGGRQILAHVRANSLYELSQLIRKFAAEVNKK